VKILTLNLLNDLSRWDERKNLIAQGVNDLQPDLIALQEVKLPLNTAQWLADQLNNHGRDVASQRLYSAQDQGRDVPPERLYKVHLCPKTGRAKNHEGIAIVSRLPVEGEAHLDLQRQGRVAQYVRLAIGDRRLLFANTHLYWEPGESKERMNQVERLLEWLRTTPADAAIVCGDFNSEPHHAATKRMRKHFSSAHQTSHGKEPDHTCPTPLTSKRNKVEQLARSMRQKMLNIVAHQNSSWRGTLDYIFVNDGVSVKACDVVLNKPAPHDPTLYPSDHFGLMATLEL
jgi:endonuclease/exonuclease/phosphatase family metal-dependent hydrolase